MADERPSQESPTGGRAPRKRPGLTTDNHRPARRRTGSDRMRTTGDYRAARTTGAYPNVGDARTATPRSGNAPASTGLRSSWTFAILATVAVAASLIFVAWAKMQTVQYTYEIDELIDVEEKLANKQRGLRSELASLRSPSNLHAMAPALGLAPPKPGHVVVITGDPGGLNAALVDSEEAVDSDSSDSSDRSPE